MSILIPIALFGWIPLSLLIFQYLPARRAVVVCFVTAILFLPNFNYGLPGLPDYNKTTAGSLGIFLAMLLKDARRIGQFRLSFFDLIMIFWCLTPLLASLANGLGLYDGLSAMKNYVVQWAFPYIIGRLYFSDFEDFEELARIVFLGGLVYVPFCLIEIVLSPQFHNWIFGYHPHEFQQSIRGSTYRPVVFLKHGLMVGMWLLAASWVGFIAWRTGRLEGKIPGLPFRWKHAFYGLVLTFFACKSMGAIAFLFILILAHTVLIKLGWKIAFYLLALFPAFYLSARLSGVNVIEPAMNFVENAVGEERAGSLRFRLENEEILADRAMESPVFGWGGWGRSRIYDDEGKDISVADSLWIIILGTTGIVGLVALFGILGLPYLAFLWKIPKQWTGHPQTHSAIALSSLLLVYLCDNLLNDMPNPLFLLIAGGLVNLAALPANAWLANESQVSSEERENTHFVPYQPKFL